MENNNVNNSENGEVKVTLAEKECKCCGKMLPLTSFDKYAAGYRNICKSCRQQNLGVSDKFNSYTSRELIQELRNRGYKGELIYTRIEKVVI